MMRRFTVLGACVVVALALGALTASAASAKKAKPKLELKHEGNIVATPHAASALIIFEGCYQYTAGTLTSNGSTKADKASFTGAVSGECEGASLTGSITSASLSVKGVASYKGTLKLTREGCSYEFKKGKFHAPFEANMGSTFGFEEATLTLAKGSPKSCAKTRTTTFSTAVVDEGEALETELT
jgi:hypothetical protein